MDKKHYLSVFGLAMLNVAAVMSLRGLPMMAETGLTMIFYLLFASFLFLIPCSLVSAELATGWPGTGGVYLWVKEAFGSNWGFVAIWLQWVQNVVWFPTVLAFAASVFAYLLENPALANNNKYTAIFILIVYWLATWLTFRGLKVAGRITSAGAIFGTIIPGLFIIVLGLVWFFTGQTIGFSEVPQHYFPSFSHFNNIAFLAGIVLLFAGMEVNAVHVMELKNPTKDYPKAIFMAMLIIIVIFSLGSLAVGTIIPSSEISLTAGIMEAFNKILVFYHMQWLLPPLSLLIAFGTVGGVLAWIAGPSKGLLATAKSGEIPPFLAHTNKNGMQTNILIIQGIIVTILASLYLLINNVSEVFFLLSAMTVSLYLVMYLLLFLSGIKLRYTKPLVERKYKIPGGNAGMWVVAGFGILSVIFAFIVSFLTPSNLEIGTPWAYVSLIVAGNVIFISLALIIHACKRPEWLQHPKVRG